MRVRKLPIPLGIIVTIVAIYLIAPMLVVIPLSFTGSASFAFPPKTWSLDYYVRFFTEPVWRDALFTSIRIGLTATLAATIIGTSAAIGLAKMRFRGKNLVNGLLLMPMIVPTIIVAVAVYAMFLRWNLVGTFWGIAVAHTMLALPFVVVSVGASLSSFDTRLELAAASLGANRWSTLRLIKIPLLTPGILSGALFAFVTSFDEVVIALYLQSPEVRTLPVQMFTSVMLNTDPTIAAASTVIVVVTTAVIIVPQLIRKGRTRGAAN